MAYAKNTTVPVDRSLGAIKDTLKRYGAEGFLHAEQGGKSILRFTYRGICLGFEMLTAESDEMDAKEERRRWRVLLLLIKAKLEVIDSGVSTFEEQFFSDIIMPGGVRIGSQAKQQITKMLETGKPVNLLPML